MLIQYPVVKCLGYSAMTMTQPFLQSPVRMRFYIHPKDTKLPKLKAGLTGLSDYTMLAEPVIPVFAMNGNL
ncbi:hypothetical protein K8T06_18125 [bacterium]|nr:hypothetical protein [bacterium]